LRLVEPGSDASYDGPAVPDPTPQGPAPSIIRAALVPASIVLCFLLYYMARLPLPVVIAIAVPFMLLFIWAPAWARASVASFDRDAVRLLSTNRREALEARLRRAFGMRIFAPPAIVAERRGLVASESGRAAVARDAYRVAKQAYGAAPPVSVVLGYAHACYELGDNDDAIDAYRHVLRTAGPLPRVQRNLAEALMRRGGTGSEAAQLLEREIESTTDETSRGELRALLQQAGGPKKKARKRA